jgi:hypothetical protein
MSQVTLEEDGTGYTITIGKGEKAIHQVSIPSVEYIERFSDVLRKGEVLSAALGHVIRGGREAMKTWEDAQKKVVMDQIRDRVLAIRRYQRHQAFGELRAQLAKHLPKVCVSPRSWFGNKQVPIQETLSEETKEAMDKERRTFFHWQRNDRWVVKDAASSNYGSVTYHILDIIDDLARWQRPSYRDNTFLLDDPLRSYQRKYEDNLPEHLSLKGTGLRQQAKAIGKIIDAFDINNYYASHYDELLCQGLSTLRAAQLLSSKAIFHFPTEFIDKLLRFELANVQYLKNMKGVQNLVRRLIDVEIAIPETALPYMAALPNPEA